MKNIIKDAFTEGRETSVDWDNSEACEIEKLITSSELKNRKIIQLRNGNMVNIFENMYIAGKYVSNNTNGSPAQLRLAIIANWKCGGYEWGALPINSPYNVTVYDDRGYIVIHRDNTIKKIKSYNDVYKYVGKHPLNAMRENGISPINGKLVVKLKDYDAEYDYMPHFLNVRSRHAIYTFHNKNNIPLEFKTVRELAKHCKISAGVVHKIINGEVSSTGKYKHIKIVKSYRNN